MHVVSVSPDLPYPDDNGQRLRTWGLLRALREHHDVTIVSWRTPRVSDEHVVAVREVFPDLHLLPTKPAPTTVAARLRRRAAFQLGAPPPYIAELVEQRDFSGLDGLPKADVLVLEEEAVDVFPIPRRGTPVVLHRLNVFSRLQTDLRSGFHGFGRAVLGAELPAWRRFDARTGRDAVLQVATTPESAAALRALQPENTVVDIPNGVALRALATSPAAGTDTVFIGWMAYHANADAVTWFAREIWPVVRQTAGQVKFRVIGREPAPEVLALHGDAVTVLGEVEDVVDSSEGVRVGVVPLRAGMGIKNKTLELMAMGLPVVSTPHGAEGIDAGEDDGLFVATSAAAFASATERLLLDGHLASRLGEAARRYVLRRFSWDAVGAQYRAVLEDVARR